MLTVFENDNKQHGASVTIHEGREDRKGRRGRNGREGREGPEMLSSAEQLTIKHYCKFFTENICNKN